MHPMTSFKHTKVRRTSVCYVKCWGVRLQRKNCTCHLYIASDEGTKSVSVCLSACLCGYLSMMTIHVSVQRGGAGGVWLAVTLILQRPWTQKKEAFHKPRISVFSSLSTHRQVQSEGHTIFQTQAIWERAKKLFSCKEKCCGKSMVWLQNCLGI